MIRFQITESPDQEVLNTFEYFHNLIYVGRTSGNITINDPALLKSHLVIEVVGLDIIVHPQKDVEFYLINGKRATTPRKLRASDTITIGKTTLKILGFEETPAFSKKNVLNRKLDALIESGSHKLGDRSSVKNAEVNMLKNSESNFYRTPDHEQLFYSKNFKEPDHSKPILVFNYGLVCSNHHWRYQLSYFEEKGYQILIHDYRGHFQSSGANDVSKITFSQIAKDTAGLCEYLGVKKAFFLGHSMGVNICLQIAKDYPDLVSGMVLISGTFMSVKDVMFDSNLMEFVTPMLEAFKKKYPAILSKIWSSSGVNPLVKAIIHATGFNKDKVSKEFIEIYLNRVGQLGPDVFFQLFSEMTKQNIVSSLDRMRMPTLIMGGQHDNVIPNHLQRTLAGILPNSETYYLYAGSHVPQADYPELVNERMDLFISQHA